MDTFYQGIHNPCWLWDGRAGPGPKFVSIRVLRNRKTAKKPTVRHAWDSGAFTELSSHGRWTISPRQMVKDVRRLIRLLGAPEFMGIMDHMCEPFMLKKTGKTVREHQRLTVESYLELKNLAPDIPWLATLQGYAPHEYLEHVEAYAKAGIDLLDLPLVGVGSVCRRQAATEIVNLLRTLHAGGLKLHAYGASIAGLLAGARDVIVSSDSMACSDAARRAGKPRTIKANHSETFRLYERYATAIARKASEAELSPLRKAFKDWLVQPYPRVMCRECGRPWRGRYEPANDTWYVANHALAVGGRWKPRCKFQKQDCPGSGLDGVHILWDGGETTL